MSSFVQTRGSIPLYWSQYPDLKYKPAMTLAAEDHVAAYTKHLRDQLQRYGNQVLLNLVSMIIVFESTLFYDIIYNINNSIFYS